MRDSGQLVVMQGVKDAEDLQLLLHFMDEVVETRGLCADPVSYFGRGYIGYGCPFTYRWWLV